MDDANILQSFFFTQINRNPDQEAVYDFESGAHYTYRDLGVRACRLANFLKQELKILPNDRIAILSKNDMVYIDTFFSTIYTGAITTTYNAHLLPEELACMIRNEQPKAIFYEKEYEDKLLAIESKVSIQHYILLDGEENPFGPHLYQQIMYYYNTQSPCIKLNDLESIILLMHTGGTTGIPKAAMLSCRAIYFNAVGQQNTWNLTSKDSTIAYLPMFHTATWNTLVLPMLYAGGHVIIMKKFQPQILMHLIAQEKVTVIWGVPSTYRRLMNDPDFMKADFSSIVWCRCGAAPPSSDVMEQYWEKGITFCNGYGMTETSPGTLSMPAGSMTLDDIRAKHTSCGKLMPYNEAKIIDDNGKEVSDGTPGELLFRGSLLFSGYWNNDEATQAAMPDGWMHTGDIGLKDKDGFFYVIGRKKHMFISNGENIYPAEIESQLFEFPAVADVCVIGVPDSQKGEVGKALIVLKPGMTATVQEIRDFLKPRLATIRIPVYIQFVDFLPKNAAGKTSLPIIASLYGHNE